MLVPPPTPACPVRARIPGLIFSWEPLPTHSWLPPSHTRSNDPDTSHPSPEVEEFHQRLRSGRITNIRFASDCQDPVLRSQSAKADLEERSCSSCRRATYSLVPGCQKPEPCLVLPPALTMAESAQEERPKALIRPDDSESSDRQKDAFLQQGRQGALFSLRLFVGSERAVTERTRCNTP